MNIPQQDQFKEEGDSKEPLDEQQDPNHKQGSPTGND